MRAVQIVLPSDKPNGLKVVTMPGWNGRCVVVPRQNLKELKDLKDNNLPGLYFLFGQDEDTGKQLAYIGESESFFARITSHDATKDFWDTAMIFNGPELNRAYVKYLEHRATMLASEAGRMDMRNKVQPQQNTLSDYDKVAVELFFEQMKFVISSLNYEIFEPIDNSILSTDLYYFEQKGIHATARLLDNGNMLVLAGSQATSTTTASFGGWAKAAREKFIHEGVVKLSKDGKSYVFTQDQLFRKPSPAAAVIAGHAKNGWIAWKNGNGKSLDEITRSGI